MNMLLVALIVLAVLFGITVIIAVIFAVDWRAFFLRRFGEDYTKGLAHIKVEGKWLYRESELVYESDIACTYARLDEKSGVICDDIVPHSIGFAYDEYTGRRVYKALPGAAVCYSDDGDAPPVNIPASLISTDTLGKIAVHLATSVKGARGPFNWKPLIFIGLILVILVGGALVTGVIKLPLPAPHTAPAAPATSDNQSQIELRQIK